MRIRLIGSLLRRQLYRFEWFVNYVITKEIIFALYNRASAAAAKPDDETYNLGVRVPCLSNRHFNYFNWPDFDLKALMAKGLTEEPYALITNPTAPTSLLESLYKKSDCFAQVDETNWMHMIAASSKNERLNIDESNRDCPDTGFWRIHWAIFHFLETAPVTSQSVHATWQLLNTLEPKHCARREEISHVIDRWRRAEVKNYKGEPEEGRSTHLSLTEELTCLIGALYEHRTTSQKNKPPLFGTAEDKDIALRCAFYGCAEMSEKEITAGYQRDKDVFVFAAIKNTLLYLSAKTRALLENYIMRRDFWREYNHRCLQIQKEYKWFDPRPTTETGRDVMEHLELIQKSSREITLLANIHQQNAELINRVSAYERRLYLAVIIVISVMYYLLKGWPFR
jgi:hypothetical protein